MNQYMDQKIILNNMKCFKQIYKKDYDMMTGHEMLVIVSGWIYSIARITEDSRNAENISYILHMEMKAPTMMMDKLITLKFSHR